MSDTYRQRTVGALSRDMGDVFFNDGDGEAISALLQPGLDAPDRSPLVLRSPPWTYFMWHPSLFVLLAPALVVGVPWLRQQPPTFYRFYYSFPLKK